MCYGENLWKMLWEYVMGKYGEALWGYDVGILWGNVTGKRCGEILWGMLWGNVMGMCYGETLWEMLRECCGETLWVILWGIVCGHVMGNVMGKRYVEILWEILWGNDVQQS
jgi:hypothetical protein